MKLKKLFRKYQTLQLLQTFEQTPHADSPFESSSSLFATAKTKRPPLPQPIQVICAWCRTVLEPGNASQGVSHGICPSCAEKIRPTLRSLCGRYAE